MNIKKISVNIGIVLGPILGVWVFYSGCILGILAVITNNVTTNLVFVSMETGLAGLVVTAMGLAVAIVMEDTPHKDSAN